MCMIVFFLEVAWWRQIQRACVAEYEYMLRWQKEVPRGEFPVLPANVVSVNWIINFDNHIRSPPSVTFYEGFN